MQRTLGEEEIWKRYGIVMKELLAAYRRGVGGVAVHDNGLVWASAPDKALTWMNALAGGVPVVSRDGYPVDINALWYNAVCYALELASRFGEEIQSYGIGSINELFDGDPPHAPWGAVSQAWSVGAVLMIRETTERWRRRRGHGLLPGLRKKR